MTVGLKGERSMKKKLPFRLLRHSLLPNLPSHWRIHFSENVGLELELEPRTTNVHFFISLLSFSLLVVRDPSCRIFLSSSSPSSHLSSNVKDGRESEAPSLTLLDTIEWW